MSNQTSGRTGGNKVNWPTVMIIGIIVLWAVSSIKSKIDRDRQAEIERQNAEAVGAFVGGALREMSK